MKVDPANQPVGKDGAPTPKRMQIDSVQSAADTDGVASDRQSKRRDPRAAMSGTKGAGTGSKEEPAPEGKDSKAQPAPAPTTPE
jgi:hypothetical protein